MTSYLFSKKWFTVIILPLLSFQLMVQAAALSTPLNDITPVTTNTETKQNTLSTAQLVSGLQSGGYIIYMRHGITNRTQKDNTQDLTDCSKQRNLSDKGREQIKQLSKTLQTLKIPIGEVLTSPYCRTKETAKLAFGKFILEPKLQFSISKNQEESQRLGEQLQQMMFQANTKGVNAVFVGHTSNLRDGLNVWPKPEGVVVVFQLKQQELIFKGMIKPNDWSNKVDINL
ncbi:MAG: histidine phosphatase family protein [Colwellia sp.]|nr:histidine phosphatase family protein [Colwellia sp.]